VVRKWWLIGISVLVVAALAVGITLRAQDTLEQRAALQPAPSPPPAVEVRPVEERTFQPTVRITGALTPRAEVPVLPRVGGQVIALGAELGDAVSAGQELIVVDGEALEAQRAQAEAQRRAAQAAVRQAEVQRQSARTERDRLTGLAARNAIPRAEVERAEAAYDGAAAAVQVARAQVAVAQATEALAAIQVSWTRVTSPIDGLVVRRSVSVGDTVGPSQPVYVVQDQSQLELVVGAPPEARAMIEVGRRLTFTVGAAPGATYEAEVAAISPTLDPETRRFRVKLVVLPDQAGLMPHMFAEVIVPVGAPERALAAPRAALVERDGATGIYVLREGRAELISARPRLVDAGWVALGPDARGDDRAVVRGQSMIRQGLEVSVVEPRAEATP